MPPLRSIVISDDEEPDPQQTLSRDLALLDEDISRAGETIKELDTEVTSYTNLLKAAQNRLHKAREQKERLIDNKQKLLDKKLRFLQSNTVARNIVNVKSKKETSIKTEPAKRPLAAAENPIEMGQVIKNSSRSENSSQQVLGSRQTHPTPTPPVQESSSLPSSLGHGSGPHASDDGSKLEIELEPQSSSSDTPILHIPKPKLPPTANTVGSFSEDSSYFGSLKITRSDDVTQSSSTSKRSRYQRMTRLRGGGSRRSYGGGLRGVRLGASIAGRTPSEHDSEEQPQKTWGKKGRATIYGPYWEASDSEPESGNSLGRKNQPLAHPTLVAQGSLRNIPVNPKTHSRIEISSVIGGKTQGTWCNINPNKPTLYNAGSYMALDRGLNHLLPKHPGENGGAYVADWLQKEVGKSYQIFIKSTTNHWLFYGKYLVTSIREVSLDEWQLFDDKDKSRWAEHMLEHRWGKNILQKKRLLTEVQCAKSNWMKVLNFFNQLNRPNLRLKILELQFISYDRDLYEALVSVSGKKGKRKRHSYESDEDVDDIWDE